MTIAPASRSQRIGFIVLGVWLAVVVALSFGHAGATPDTWTRVAILAYLATSLALYRTHHSELAIAHPRRVFLGLALLGAIYGELAYMISRPLDPSLLVVAEMPPRAIARSMAIDLALTIPAYLMILPTIWWFARRYRYTPLGFCVVFGLAQALGDGGAYFVANPLMLLFAPYVMTNYWAMTFVPYLVVRHAIPDDARRPAGATAHLLPLVAIPAVYFVAASIVITAGRLLGWLPS